MAETGMACIVLARYSRGLYIYGPYSYGLYLFNLYCYGLYNHVLYSYGQVRNDRMNASSREGGGITNMP